MKKYIAIIVGALLIVGLIALAANMDQSDSDLEFYSNSFRGPINIELPKIRIGADTLRNWTGSYWNYSQYDDYSVYIRDTSLSVEFSENGWYYANLSISFDAYGNSTYSYYAMEWLVSQEAEASFSGPQGYYVDVYIVNRSISISTYDLAEFLRLYVLYEVQPRVDSAYYYWANISSYDRYNNNSTYYNYSNSSYYNYSNYTNDTTYNRSNYTNQTYFPDPINGPANLSLYLPSRNISWKSANMSIYVFNASFYGNYTSKDNFTGRIYAQFDVRAIVNNTWYPYFIAYYDQDIVYDVWTPYSCNEYYNYSLLSDSVTLRDILFNYFYDVAKPAIIDAITNSSNSTTQKIPGANITGWDLQNWYNVSWWVYYNYTAVGYFVNISSANFTGNVSSWGVNGTIKVSFDAYGNDSYTPYYNQSQTWEYSVGATIQVLGNWVSSIDFDRQLAIYPSDLRNFLGAWVYNKAIPYLMNNSSNSSGVKFPEYNVTGFDLNNWIQQYNAYPNYTWAGYYVYVYNFTTSLEKYGNNVYGSVVLSFTAFGNDTNYPCSPQWWNYYCPQIQVYSNATIYVYGVQSNDSIPYFGVDYRLRVNYTDVQNFLRGYFYAVMVPNITDYYNITTNTTNRTIYLPNYNNDTQITIDCSIRSWYCSGANPQSSIFFIGANGYNLSITVNSRGSGYFNGVLNIPYVANLINFTSTYYGKETIVDNLQGNATINVFGWVNGTGNGTYYVTVDSYSYPFVVFDRNYFVQNAAQQIFYDRYSWYLQYFVNSILSSNRTYY